MTGPRRIVLLGATGSIGRSVVDVVTTHPDRFRLVALAGGSRADAMAEVARAHPDAALWMADVAARAHLERAGLGDRLLEPGTTLETLIDRCEPDLVVNAVVGFAGFAPTLHALSRGLPVAIANKETVVAGGPLLEATCRRTGACLIPVDSEHAAIAQCLRGERIEDVDRVVITASGGALRDVPIDRIADATREAVLAHPTWCMGEKVTVDSATLVNKALEVIEARWLFGLAWERIDVAVHPQSIVHSLVRFVDGSIVAQMGEPDMRLPVLFALSWPDRVPSPVRHDVLDFPALTFERVDVERYPCFALVRQAGEQGGTAPAVANAANEVAVAAFLEGRIPLPGIRDMIAAALDGVAAGPVREVADVLEADAAARRFLAERFGAAVVPASRTPKGRAC